MNARHPHNPTDRPPVGGPESPRGGRPQAAPLASRRRFGGGLLALGAAGLGMPLLSGCAGADLTDFSGQKPTFDFRRYFDGRLVAHGMVLNRSGKVLRRMVVTMDCSWTDGPETTGVLDESFVYDDGERQQRKWRVRREANGRYTGTADDVVGTATGAATGPAFNWRYTLKVPVGDSVYDLDFDDWMVLIDDDTLLNKAVMSKLGVRVGEVLLSFRHVDRV
ncbi:DUF3833 domain-containing protein [Roseateles amylovorans]